MTSDFTEAELLQSKLDLLNAEKYLQKNLGFKFAHKFYQWQRDFINSKSKMILLSACNQAGKVFIDAVMVPTPGGFRRHGDLQIGDYVFGRNGCPTKIIDIPFDGEDEFYNITFDDGSSVVAGQDHLWIAKDGKSRFKKEWARRGKNKGKFTPNKNYDKWKEYSTNEIIKTGRYSPETEPRLRFSIPIAEPVEYPKQDQEIDAYTLGALLGDGSFRCGSPTIDTDKEIINYIKEKHEIKEPVLKRGCYSSAVYGITEKLKKLKLSDTRSDTKFIPREYLLGSVKQRKELLFGLMDTDGYCSKEGKSCVEYCTTSEQLKDDIIELINSLGGVINSILKRTGKYKKDGVTHECKDYWRFTIKTTFNPFKLKRKADLWKIVEKYKHERIIYKIESVGKQKGRCISVDNSDGSYLATKSYIVTHNSSCQLARACYRMFSTVAERVDYFPVYQPGEKIMFVYFYPDMDTATREFENKWQKYLPQDKFKNDKLNPDGTPNIYWWKEHYLNGKISSIEFTDGELYFMSYGKSSLNVQASTIFELYLDEELPFYHYNELISRLNATSGAFCMVFTSTLGELEWYRAMECQGTPDELFPDAHKKQVSLLDCLVYEDGSPTSWTLEKIKRIEAQYPDEDERLRRVHGRIIISKAGLLIKHLKGHHIVYEKKKEWNSWHLYCGIDIGSGGKNHKSGIVVTAVRPDYKKCAVVYAWREDDLPTSEFDVLNKYKEIIKQCKSKPVTFYDYHAKDFEDLVMKDKHVSMYPAEKSHQVGFGILNSLFKNDMCEIYLGEDSGDTDKLVLEIKTCKEDAPKTSRKDDLCFTKGHLVATSRGLVDISKIKIGDEVWTRNGFRRVLLAMTRETIVIERKIKGIKIKGTPKHNFIKENNEKKQLVFLTDVDMLGTLNKKEYLKCLMQKTWTQLSLTVLNSGDTLKGDRLLTGATTLLTVITGKEELKTFIKRYGFLSMAKFLRGLISIMLTAMHSIMIFLIWSAKTKASMLQNILRKDIRTLITRIEQSKIWTELDHLLKSGMQAKKGPNGTHSMAKMFLAICLSILINAINVVKSTSQKLSILREKILRRVLVFAQTTASPNGDEKVASTTLRKLVLFVVRLSQQINIAALKHALSRVRVEYVHNLTVEKDHEYYVNGFSVSNCDGFRYGLSTLLFDFSDTEEGKNETKKETKPGCERQKYYDEKEQEKDRILEGSIEAEFEFWNDLM